eukprot:1103874-Pyramimonas_sp.AAC.1
MERLRGNLPQEDQHRGAEYPEGQVQRFKGWNKPELARKHIPAEQMEYWLNRGWNEHQIRHW